MKRYSVVLFLIVVLILVIMPALLYLAGWAAQRYTNQTPVWINGPRPKLEPRDKPAGEAPATQVDVNLG